MQRKNLLISSAILFAGVIIVGAWYVWGISSEDDTPAVPPIHVPRDLGINISGPFPRPQRPPIQVTKVNKAVIPKELFERGTKDMEISVGNVFGEFTVAEIEESSNGRHSILFEGETTIIVSLWHNSFPAFVLSAEKSETNKLPQIYQRVTNPPTIVESLVIGSSVTKTEDFVFTNGDSNSRRAEVRVTNLKMFIPAVDAFGTADISAVRYLD